MKRALTIACLMAFVSLWSLNADCVAAQALTLEPERPEAGETVLVTYDTNDPSAVLTGNEPLFLVDNAYRERWVERIPMTERDGIWTAELGTYPEIGNYHLLSVSSGDEEDTNAGEYWEVLLHEDGVPMAGAYSLRGRLKAQFIEDEDAATAFRLEQFRKEYQLYPEESNLLGTIWSLQIELGEDPSGIHMAARARAEHLLSQDPEDLTAYNQATRLLRQVDLEAEAEAIVEQYKSDPPTIDFEALFARSELSESLREEKDSARRIALMKDFIDSYGDVPTGWGESTYRDSYESRLLLEYMETEDLEGILSLADAVINNGRSSRAGHVFPRRIGVLIARLDGDLDEARRFVGISEDRIPDAYDFDIMRPTSYEPPKARVMIGKEAEAEAFFERLEAEIDVAYAFLDAKDGRIGRALRAADKAAPLLAESVDGLMLYGEILMMADHHESAFETFRAVAMLSPGHAEARRMLKQSWIGMHESEEGYYEAVAAIEEDWRAMRSVELVEERGSNQAADFTTMLLASNTAISKKDLEGKVVVIDFWASWCGPCLKAFPDLNTTFKKYQNRDDVMFLVVNTGWSNTIEDARKFAAANDYEFPYTMDAEGVMTKAFSVQGIPTTVVLDPEGREAFRHLGYEGPDYVAELSLEIDLLLGDYVVKQGTN